MIEQSHLKMHSLDELPKGKTVGDIIPVFAGITKAIRVGAASKVCASCRKPFSSVRKARKEIRLYPFNAGVPIAWFYPICGSCVAAHQRGGTERDAVLASIEAFHQQDEASQ